MRKARFYARYVRSYFLMNRPVVCHFFATERCNLECSYCSVYKAPRPEADLPSTRKIIDRVAKLGVANFSITGGEPLLRREIYDIIAYAAEKLPYVRITSNGTMPPKAYERLLETPIDGFSISVDTVSNGDGRRGKGIENSFDAVDYLFHNRGARRMNLSTSFYGDNGDDLARLINFSAKHWPGLSIFIQPVVVGKGHLRSEGKRIDPRILFELSRAPNVSNTAFFNRICQDYFENPDFVFDCRAGRLFFGIRPDGEYWACHDVPTPLNILDDDFFQKRRAIDFKAIADPKKCGSCIYSCYINLQKGFETVSLPLMVSTIRSFSRSFFR